MARLTTTRRPDELEADDALAGLLPLILGLAVLAVTVTLLLVRSAPTTPSITVRNPTRYHLEISARAETGQAPVPLAAVSPGSNRELLMPVDHGEVWVIGVSYGGRRLAEVPVGRQQLVDGWEIPADVGRKLEREGTPEAVATGGTTSDRPAVAAEPRRTQ